MPTPRVCACMHASHTQICVAAASVHTRVVLCSCTPQQLNPDCRCMQPGLRTAVCVALTLVQEAGVSYNMALCCTLVHMRCTRLLYHYHSTYCFHGGSAALVPEPGAGMSVVALNGWLWLECSACCNAIASGHLGQVHDASPHITFGQRLSSVLIAWPAPMGCAG